MNKKTLVLLPILMFTISIYSQVGIGNQNPQGTLDITASNQAAPSNEDGILIPRIDTFPATNPTVTQDSMIVYLTTTVGTDAPGFYYWNNATTNWLPFGGASLGWEITGNAGTLSGTNFLGTTDAQALDVRTNDVIRVRFTTDSKIEILNSGNSVYIGENAGAADPTTVAKENVMIGTNAGQDITTGAGSAFEGAYSTGVGFNALASQTTGNRNTAVGNNAASNTTTGDFNVAVGQDALLNAVGANYNTALGQDAIENVEGDRNTAVGYRALAGKQNATIGSATRNTVVGTQAGLRVQDATNNVWLGDDVDQFNNDGIQNTIVGSQAGASFGAARDLNGRVLIGYQAGSTLGGADNTLYIENSDSETPLIYGEFDNDILRIGGQLQVGRSDGTVGSIYAFPTVDGTTDQVLTTDGSGNVTWQNGASADADWFAQGTTDAPTAITDNIFTNGNVGIGDTTPDAELDIEAATGDATLIITADPTDTNEENNPVISLVQDGGSVTGQIEMGSDTFSANDLVISTSNTNTLIIPPTVTDYVTGFSGPRGLLLNGNDLYIAEANSGKILKVDITQASPTPVEVLTGLSQPRALALDASNNMLYIAEWGNERIIKIDITQATPALQVVTTNIATPYSIALAGNELFIADSLIGRILKLNITDAIPTVSTEVITGLGYPQSLAINGNDLYISEGTNDMISKIDITQATPTKTVVLATTGSPFHMSMISGKLYFTEIVTDKLAYLEVNAATPTTSTDVVTGINGAYGFVYDGTDFYVGALFDNKIVKVENSLSVDEELFDKNSIKIYPNPTSSYLKISGLQKQESYKIYNNLGQKVASGTISKNESIDVNKHMNGIYLITFSSGTSYKFIKK